VVDALGLVGVVVSFSVSRIGTRDGIESVCWTTSSSANGQELPAGQPSAGRVAVSARSLAPAVRGGSAGGPSGGTGGLSLSASALALKWVARAPGAGAASCESSWSGTAVLSCFRRPRAAAAAAATLAAAPSAETPASLRQRGARVFAGASRRAAEKSSAEIFGAALS
jgi:hypothetical protein